MYRSALSTSLIVAVLGALGSACALGACDVGEVPTGDGGGGGGGGAGEASFTAMVAPLITECHMAGACHSVQQPVLTSFSTIAARFLTKPGSSSSLVTKGALTGGIHQGLPYLTADEQATVAAWIDSLP